MVTFSKGLLALSVYWDLSSTSGCHSPSLETQEKWPRNWQNPPAMASIYKCSIGPKREYICWSNTILSFQPRRSSKAFTRSINHELFSLLQHCKHIATISLILLKIFRRAIFHQTFTTKPCHVMCPGVNQSHFLDILLVRRKFHADNFFPWAVALCNRLSRGGFSDHCNLNHLGFRVNRYP